MTDDFNTKNHKPAVTFNCKDLARDAAYYVSRQVNEVLKCLVLLFVPLDVVTGRLC